MGANGNPLRPGRPRQDSGGRERTRDAVRVTLGPKGRQRHHREELRLPTVTKDRRHGSRRRSSSRTSSRTWGAQMCARSLRRPPTSRATAPRPPRCSRRRSSARAPSSWSAGMNPMELKRGIGQERRGDGRRAEEDVEADARPGGDRPGRHDLGERRRDRRQMLAEAMAKVGKEGVITVEEAKAMDSTLEVVEGMQFDRGYLSPYFVTDPDRMEVVLEIPSSFSTRRDLEHEGHAAPARAGRAPGQAAADRVEDVEGEALATLVVNKIRARCTPPPSRRRLRRSGRKAMTPGHGDPHRWPGQSPRSSA